MNDARWYKGAIIYGLHVKAFLDSNADGVGDFRGLIDKLDYLTDLGVDCVYTREYDDELFLIVNNLSRFAQPIELDLRRYDGRVPVELFGETRFPPIGEPPYFLTPGPHSFYWFRLEQPAG